MSRSEKLRKAVKTAGLAAYGLVFTGLFMMMLSVLGAEIWQWPVWLSAFIRDVGLLLAAVMAGTILHEKLLRDEMVQVVVDELDQRLDAGIPKLSEVASETARETHKLFCDSPPGMTGIRLVDDTRRNYSGYYSWVNEQKAQDLFFAGRSVLHRIDADIRTRTATSAESILLRRLKEGSKIRILFLDPRIDIVDRLAIEEGQTPQAMLGDIATSIGISRRLFDLLQQNFASLPPGAELTIRVYDRVPYFAYHKQDDDVIVGFYFLSAKGSSSAAYELVDGKTKEVFGDHFVGMLSAAATSTLVEFDGARGRPSINESLFEELGDCLRKVERLGEEKTAELMSRRVVPPVSNEAMQRTDFAGR